MYWIPLDCAHIISHICSRFSTIISRSALFSERKTEWVGNQSTQQLRVRSPRATFNDIQDCLVLFWLVVSIIFYFPFHIWDNPSHWLSYFSRWLKPPTSSELFGVFFYFLLEHRGSLSQGVLGDCPERINPKSTGQSSFGLPGLVMTNIATV